MLVSELDAIDCCVDPVRWRVKPDDLQIAGIVKRIPWHPQTLTLAQMADVWGRGQTVYPGKLSKPNKSGEFVVSQQAFPIDVDHETDPLSPCVTVNALRDNGVVPAIVYHSFSSDPYKPRYRVVVVTNAPAMGAEQIRKVYAGLLHVVRPAADPSSGDLARMFLGASQTFPLAVRKLWEFGGDGEAPTVGHIESLAPPTSSADVFARRKKRGCGRRKKADEYLISHVDLLAYVRRVTGERGRRSGGNVTFHRCPVCGHYDHFVVTPDPDGADTWTCFGSHGVYEDENGKRRHPGGTIVDLQMWMKGGVHDD